MKQLAIEEASSHRPLLSAADDDEKDDEKNDEKGDDDDDENDDSDGEKSNSNYYARYLSICENMEILRNPNKTHCPRPNCNNVCLIDASSASTSTSMPIKVTCDKCSLDFCSKCLKQWNKCENDIDNSDDQSTVVNIQHETFSLGNCECCCCSSSSDNKSKRKSVDDSLLDATSLAHLENIKRCPKCGVLIERADGCAQIMCKICKHTFCFYCLTSLDVIIIIFLLFTTFLLFKLKISSILFFSRMTFC